MKFKTLSFITAAVLAVSGTVLFSACKGPEEAPPEETPDTRPFVVGFGDSGAEGGGSSLVKIEDAINGDKLNDDGSYNFKRVDGSYLKIAGEIMGCRVENYSTGGYVTADILSQLKTNKYGCADAVKEADYIYIGILNNEFNMVREQVIAEAERNQYTTANSVISNLYNFEWPELMELLEGLNPDAKIIVNNYLSYWGYWTGDLEDLAESTGLTQANYRLWKNVVLRYLEEHPGAYETVDLTGRESTELSYSNGDAAHPNDRYNMKLAIGTVASFAELGYYTRNDAQEAENLKAYIPTLWDGFNRYMAYLKETGDITEDVSVDIEAFNEFVRGMASLQEVADAYCEMFTEKDPRPYTGM